VGKDRNQPADRERGCHNQAGARQQKEHAPETQELPQGVIGRCVELVRRDEHQGADQAQEGRRVSHGLSKSPAASLDARIAKNV